MEDTFPPDHQEPPQKPAESQGAIHPVRRCRYCHKPIPDRVKGHYCSISHMMADKRVLAPSRPRVLPIQTPDQFKRFDWKMALVMIVGTGVMGFVFYRYVDLHAIVMGIHKIETSTSRPRPTFAVPTHEPPRPTATPDPRTPIPHKTPFTQRNRDLQNERIERVYKDEDWYPKVKALLKKEWGREPEPVEVLFNSYRVNELKGEGK